VSNFCITGIIHACSAPEASDLQVLCIYCGIFVKLCCMVMQLLTVLPVVTALHLYANNTRLPLRQHSAAALLANNVTPRHT
jgi:hypothetical protein